MYQKILVPYDGSKPSNHALKHAVDIAKLAENNAEITVLYVVEKILLPPLSPETTRSLKTGEVINREEILKEIYYDEKRSAMDMLEKASKSIRSPHLQIRLKVLYGVASEKILEFANKGDTDLIVIGNVGLSGISKLKALGSVSRAISEGALCPVMIVH